MTTTTSSPPIPTRPRPGRRTIDAAIGRTLDAAMEVGVVAFASWTLLYHVGLVLRLRPSVLLLAWLLLLAALAVLRSRRRVRRAAPVLGGQKHVFAALFAAGAAILAAFLVRPDLDDASYVVRSTWVAERDDLGTRDVIFTHGRWDALVGQDPYLPSVETLIGSLSRVLGVSTGSTAYLVWTPLASFAAVWGLWMLLRAWRLRSPVAALVLALVLLLWGGAVHASWGNLHLGRIWQGKVTLLAVLVPATYAWCAAYWRSAPGRRRSGALVLVAAAGVAAVGLSPAGVFVVPEVVVVGALYGLVARRPGRALLLTAVGCGYPLMAGLVTRLAGNLGAAEVVVGDPINPWLRTLGQGAPAAVVALAATAALIGWWVPRLSGIGSDAGRTTAAASVLVGGLIGLPPMYGLLAALMGTEAIAWRAIWVVPVPALVGALASSPPRARFLGPVVGGGTAVVLVLGGLPLWSAGNGAHLAAAPDWKFAAGDLVTARWLADHAPQEGTYLARTGVVAATGVLTSELMPVGSRLDYLAQYSKDPAALVDDRSALQWWVDGAEGTADPAVLARQLAALDVQVVCAPAVREPEMAATWVEVARPGTDICWTRR